MRYQATKAQEWKPEALPVDTAPGLRTPPLDPSKWGVTAEQARDMLTRQMCPVCGEGPWKSPLNHASRKHGFDRFEMRNACGLTATEVVVDPELSAKFSENGKGRDMTEVHRAAKTRQKQRWTKAGATKNAETLVAWEAEHPEEALRARGASGRLGAAARWSK